MPIKCKICDKEFPFLITSTHLKQHDILTADYKLQYGKDSLASPEYRERRSIENSGVNNPNFGNKMSLESRKLISIKHKGNTSWNKGMKFNDTTNQRAAAAKREERYKNGELERYIPVPSTETKRKISESVIEYAKNNKDEIILRSQKAITTKIQNGYYAKKRLDTENKFSLLCDNHGFTVHHINDNIATIGCNVCNSTHTRSMSSKVHKNMCPLCSNIGASSYEAEVLDELKKILDTDYIISDKSVLGNLELDIFIPNFNFAIEVDGLYWHSEEAGKGKFYHSYKTNKCLEKGIQLIHIFEDEWVNKREICIDRLKSKLGLVKPEYARKFKTIKISNKEAYDFLSKHHIQGRGTAASHCYGLIDSSNDICAVMTFSKLNIAKGSSHVDGKFELNRYASRGNIIGGASKLFSRFVEDVNPDEIISYSDLRWNTGNLYEKLGFVLSGKTLPNYWYLKGIERIHRYKLRKTEFDPKDKTEKELRSAEGYKRIWDCGNTRWIWNKSNNVRPT